MTTTTLWRPVWATAAALWTACATLAAAAPGNLLLNGGFDHPDDPLYGWKYKYDLEGESFYFTNHERVSVIQEGTRKGVLSLYGNMQILFDTGQGTKVDSFPVRVEPGGRYKLSVTARSTGPSTRILIEGYKWKPGIKPHGNPQLHELRKCYKSRLVYFGGQKGGDISKVGKSWQTASQIVPDPGTPELGQKMFNQAEFLVVHIVAIDGSEGALLVDEVHLERLNK